MAATAALREVEKTIPIVVRFGLTFLAEILQRCAVLTVVAFEWSHPQEQLRVQDYYLLGGVSLKKFGIWSQKWMRLGQPQRQQAVILLCQLRS